MPCRRRSLGARTIQPCRQIARIETIPRPGRINHLFRPCEFQLNLLPFDPDQWPRSAIFQHDLSHPKTCDPVQHLTRADPRIQLFLIVKRRQGQRTGHPHGIKGGSCGGFVRPKSGR